MKMKKDENIEVLKEELALHMRDRYPDSDILTIDFYGAGSEIESPIIRWEPEFEDVDDTRRDTIDIDYDPDLFRISEDLLAAALEINTSLDSVYEGDGGIIRIQHKSRNSSFEVTTAALEPNWDNAEVFTLGKTGTPRIIRETQINETKQVIRDYAKSRGLTGSHIILCYDSALDGGDRFRLTVHPFDKDPDKAPNTADYAPTVLKEVFKGLMVNVMELKQIDDHAGRVFIVYDPRQIAGLDFTISLGNYITKYEIAVVDERI